MSNVIKIKRGSGTPTTSNLAEYELAYDYTSDKLYIHDPTNSAGQEIVEITGSSFTTGPVADGATTLATGNAIYDHVTSRISGFVDTSGTPIASEYARFTDSNTVEGISAAGVRTDLGLVIGTNIQAQDDLLQDIADLSTDNQAQDGYVLAYNDGTPGLELVEQSPGTITAAQSMTNDYVLTATGSTTLQGESGLRFGGQYLSIQGNDPSNTYGVKEKLRIHRSGGNTDRQLQIYEMRHSGGREFLQAFNLDITTDNSSGYTYTQGSYGGSSYIEFDNAGSLKFYNDTGVSSGSRNAITPSLSMWIGGDNNILMPGKLGIGWTSGLPNRALDVKGGIELSANDNTLDLNNFALRRDSSGGGNIDVPGDMTINIDANNNQTDAVFEICANGSATGVFKVAETGTVTTGTWNGTAIAASYIANLPASKITTGGFDIDRLPTAAVTDGDFDNVSTANAIYDFVTGQGYLTSVPNLDASKITSGTFADARIALSSITQHTDPKYLRSNADDQSTGVLTVDTLKITNDSSDTSRHRVAVFDSGSTSYGMMLWNSNGTGGDWSTMIYGPNQSNRRISFGKINNATFADHADVSEIAHFDLDDSTLRLTADAYVNSNKVWHAGNDGSGTGLDADTLDGSHASAFLTSVPNHSANLLTSGTVPLARISGLTTSNIASDAAIQASQLGSLPASQITSGTFSAARIPNLDASKITSGTVNNARLNTDMQLTSAAPRYRLQESGVTNTPNWWMIADGGNYSIRLNNTGTYPLQIITNSDNNAVSNITLGYSTSITGSLNINNRFTSTGTGGFTIGNYAGYDRIQNSSNIFSFLTDGNAQANMQFGTVTVGTWNGSVIASAYLDSDTAHLSGTQTFSGAKTFSSDIISNGIEVGTAYGSDSQYLGIKRSGAGANDYLIMQGSAGDAGSTYITAGSGKSVNIRPSANSTTNQLVVSASGTTIGGNTVWHAGNDGTGSALDADLLDGLHGSSYWSKSGSWVGDLASNGYSRVQGVSNGGGEFVLALKNGQLHTLLDGSYIAYEASTAAGGGFWSSYNSSYGNASGFKASANDKIRVQQLDGGTADLEVTGNIKLTNERGLLWDYTPNTSLGGYIAHPGGGMYRTSAGTHTGALTITIPTGGGPADMISFWVDVFDYTTYESQSFYLAGYVYQTAGSNEWVNETAMMLTPKENHARTVRFGHNGTNHVVYIGELADTWSYPQVTVRNVQIGFGSDVDTYNDNWDISFEASSFQNVDATYSGADTLPTAGKIKMKDGSGKFVHNTTSSRDKIRVWNSSNYAIGMQSANNYGGLANQYAMTFNMDNTANRGFLWVKDSHSQSQGAMSLTTDGKLTVAHSTRIGYGESDTTTPGATYRLDVSGSIGATADVVAYISSDKRLKDNIKNIANPLDKLNKLNGVEFDWNDKQDLYQGHDIGVIAQEVEEVLPEIVDTRKDGHKAVKYDRMVALLIEAVKEQQVQINELKTKLGE